MNPSNSLPLFDVAIIGAGFAGVACAVHLADRAPKLRIVLLDPAEHLPAGLPFAGARPEHLLNVRAEHMSMRSCDPGAFSRFVAEHQGAEIMQAQFEFAPRRLYARYTASVLEYAVACMQAPGEIVHLRWQVESIERDDRSFRVRAAHHCSKVAGPAPTLQARQIILALGAGAILPFLRDPMWCSGPWQLQHVPEHLDRDRALIIGRGLTGVDSLQTLHLLGWRGQIDWIAPSERLPQCSLPRDSAPWVFASNFEQSCAAPRSFLAALRAEVLRARDENVDWRSVIDALRPITQRIFSGWSASQRRSMRVRLASIWSAHRHRMPPPVHALVNALRNADRFVALTGRVVSAQRLERGIEVVTRVRGQTHKQSYALVLDARGPNYQLQSWPLLQSMLAKGLVKASATGLGIEVTNDGQAAEHIFALGAVCYGERLETTAVPELRVQAERIAALIASNHRD